MILIIDGLVPGIIDTWYCSSSLDGYMIKTIQISKIENFPIV